MAEIDYSNQIFRKKKEFTWVEENSAICWKQVNSQWYIKFKEIWEFIVNFIVQQDGKYVLLSFGKFLII